jgi:hypothetical protein
MWHAEASDVTPLIRQSTHNTLARNFFLSLSVQYGMVFQVHVRRFHTSRTPFIVMLYCFASALVVPSRGERDALAR